MKTLLTEKKAVLEINWLLLIVLVREIRVLALLLRDLLAAWRDLEGEGKGGRTAGATENIQSL